MNAGKSPSKCTNMFKAVSKTFSHIQERLSVGVLNAQNRRFRVSEAVCKMDARKKLCF
jgi:hypothetical protein